MVLAQFIKYLESENLVKFDILREDDECFWNRFKIQKYTFLAMRFGLDLPYKHSMYLYGPYSSTLTDEYYSLAKNPKQYEATQSELPQQFRRDDFLSFVRSKNNGWLEIAATLLSKREFIPRRDDLVENTENTKVGFSREFIDEALRDLEGANLIKCDQ